MTRVPLLSLASFLTLSCGCNQAPPPAAPQNSPAASAPFFASANGGQTWTRKTVPGMTAIQDIEFFSANDIYLSGSDNNDGRVLKSSNGGAYWSQLYAVTGVQLGDLEISNGRIFATGQTLYMSPDNGTTWAQATTLPTGGTIRYTDLEISEVDLNVLFLSGSSGVFKSTDGGATWANILAGNYKSVDEPTPGTLVVVGPDIATTSDQGVNWTHFSTGGAQMNSVLFNGVGSGNGMAVGASGSMFRSTNAGMSWNAVASGSGADLVDVTYFNSTWFAITSATVLRSLDEGATWPAALQQALPLNGSETVNQISVLDSLNGWIAGKN